MKRHKPRLAVPAGATDTHIHIYLEDAELLDLLLDWAPGESTRRKILVDNPVELYAFP